MTRFRIASFSLVELLVVMVLSSIIVGVIYFSFETISSYQVRLFRQKRQAEDAGTFYYILKKDMQQSAIVRALHVNAIQCEYDPERSIEYAFFPGYVLRSQLARVDTFLLDFGAPALSHAGLPIEKFPAMIDEIRLREEKHNGVPLNIQLFKYYDAASLMQMTKKDSVQ